MTHLRQHPPPVMGTGASLYTNQARIQVCEKGEEITAFQLPAEKNFTFRINPANLENILGNIRTNCSTYFHGRPPFATVNSRSMTQFAVQKAAHLIRSSIAVLS